MNFDTELLIICIPCFGARQKVFIHGMGSCGILGLIFFLILGLRIFFQNIKVGGGKKIKIKITKKNFFFYLI